MDICPFSSIGLAGIKNFPFYKDRLPKYSEVREALNQRHNIDLYEKTRFEESWFTVCLKNNLFQLWNKEYIEQLAIEIKKLVGKDLVLEVCAGDGMLSHWLRNYGINIKATDNMAWHEKSPKINFRSPIKLYGEVENLDAINSIIKYNPRLVISSWIDYDSELDCQIIDEKVEYIILIGETDGGCVGSHKFWGEYDEKPYWKQSGYIQKYLDDIDKWNICRTDYPESVYHSQTRLYIRSKI